MTTHYPEVKQYAERAEGMVNARMTFDKESLKPTYRLVIGEAGESCAFYIAGKLGMPEPMLECAARAAYGATALPEEIRRLAAENRIRKEKTGGIQKRKMCIRDSSLCSSIYVFKASAAAAEAVPRR